MIQQECDHEKIEICGTLSCPTCYYNELMSSRDKAPKFHGDYGALLLPTHPLLRYKEEKKRKEQEIVLLGTNVS